MYIVQFCLWAICEARHFPVLYDGYSQPSAICCLIDKPLFLDEYDGVNLVNHDTFPLISIRCHDSGLLLLSYGYETALHRQDPLLGIYT